ncbi:18441_t:CDS:10, partial [Dentiscutata erythropus]
HVTWKNPVDLKRSLGVMRINESITQSRAQVGLDSDKGRLKGKSTIPPECLVVVVLDATYRLEDHYETIFGTYLRPILKHLKAPYVKEQEDKEKKEKVPVLKCGLVTFGHYEPYSTIPVKSHYFESLARFDELISEIEFLNGGIYENAVAEGLVAALEMFDLHKSQMEPDAPQPIRHCILVSNSHPCPDPVHRNISSKYDEFTIPQIVEEMQEQCIYFSLITPERDFPDLEKLVEMVNQDVEVHNVTEVINSSHVVKLANFKLTFSQPNDATPDKKRKCETSTSTNDTNNNDQATSSTLTSSSPESKRVKLEASDEQLPNSTVQQPLVTEPSSNQKESITITKSVQPPSSKPPQTINVAISRASPALTSINTIPPQLSNPQDALGHTQVSAKPPQQPVQSTAPIQIQHPPSIQQPVSISGTQPMRPPMTMGPRLPAAAMKAQFQAQWNAMSPEQRTQFLTMAQAAQAAAANNSQALRQNGQLFRSQVANNTQQILRQQNQFLQNELAASQQNLADAIVRSKMTQLCQNNIQNVRVPVGSQPINNFVTSPSPHGSDAQSINCFVTSPTVGGTQNLGTLATSFSAPTLNIPNMPTSTQGGQISTTTVGTSVASALGVQIPKTIASTNPSTSASSSNNGTQISVTNTTGAALGSNIRPNIPQKVNALWSGHIAWSANSQQTGLKRELTCHVTAFPGNQRKTGPFSVNDYMIQAWPDKMEISSINLAKDFMRDAALQNPKPHVVSFLPTPNPQASQASQDNHNTFMVLMRILDSKKLAAFVRFSNAPNPNGGIVLFTTGTGMNTGVNTTGLRLVGLLFLDSPLPTSVTHMLHRQVNPAAAAAMLQQPSTADLINLRRRMQLTSLIQAAQGSNPVNNVDMKFQFDVHIRHQTFPKKPSTTREENLQGHPMVMVVLEKHVRW